MFDTLSHWLQGLSFLALVSSLGMGLLSIPLWRLRKWAASVLYFSSWAWVLALWVVCAIDLYNAWGLVVLVVGVLMFGVGVIPLAVICYLAQQRWIDLGYAVLLLSLNVAGRILTAVLMRSYETALMRRRAVEALVQLLAEEQLKSQQDPDGQRMVDQLNQTYKDNPDYEVPY